MVDPNWSSEVSMERSECSSQLFLDQHIRTTYRLSGGITVPVILLVLIVPAVCININQHKHITEH